MGLDNGFVVKKMKREDIPAFIDVEEYPYGLEFAYMRKCWGIRNELVKLYHMDSEKDCEYKLDIEDFNATLRILKSYLYADKFDDDGSAFWTFKEYGDRLVDNYIALSWLFNYIKNGHSKIEVVFYDSY